MVPQFRKATIYISRIVRTPDIANRQCAAVTILESMLFNLLICEWNSRDFCVPRQTYLSILKMEEQSSPLHWFLNMYQATWRMYKIKHLAQIFVQLVLYDAVERNKISIR